MGCHPGSFIMGVFMSDMLKLAAALRAAAAVLEGGEVSAPIAAVDHVAVLGDKIADFLRNDQSSFDWRSASAIAKALDVETAAVETAAKQNRELSTRQSTRTGMGLLISLA